MIKIQNLISIPTKDKMNQYLLLGISLIILSFIDLVFSSFFEINITFFLPRWLNYFTPLLFGFLGLYYIRIEFSGNKTLDSLNKNINSNWFNSILTLLIIFVVLFFFKIFFLNIVFNVVRRSF